MKYEKISKNNMKLKNFFTGWMWNLVIGAINILAYIGIKAEIVVNYLGKLTAQSVLEILFLVLAILTFPPESKPLQS